MRILTGVLTVFFLASAAFAANTRVRHSGGEIKYGEFLKVQGTEDVRADALKLKPMTREGDRPIEASASVDLRNLLDEELFVTFAIVLLDGEGNVVACGTETPMNESYRYDKVRHGIDRKEGLVVTVFLGLVDISSAKTYKVTVTTSPVK